MDRVAEAARAQGYSDDEVTAWRKQWEDWHAWHAQYAATSGDAAAQGDESAESTFARGEDGGVDGGKQYELELARQRDAPKAPKAPKAAAAPPPSAAAATTASPRGADGKQPPMKRARWGATHAIHEQFDDGYPELAERFVRQRATAAQRRYEYNLGSCRFPDAARADEGLRKLKTLFRQLDAACENADVFKRCGDERRAAFSVELAKWGWRRGARLQYRGGKDGDDGDGDGAPEPAAGAAAAGVLGPPAAGQLNLGDLAAPRAAPFPRRRSAPPAARTARPKRKARRRRPAAAARRSSRSASSRPPRRPRVPRSTRPTTSWRRTGARPRPAAARGRPSDPRRHKPNAAP
ncbi:hypothetical protein JL722_692 [Aureococcus anophagefferens]|nr:hypothetical protein JL722_692 [Aureococcus anophagefferens]